MYWKRLPGDESAPGVGSNRAEEGCSWSIRPVSSSPPDPVDSLRCMCLKKFSQCLDEMNIGLAITRCSIGYKVWAIDGGPIAEGPLSGAGASFCIQGWKTCQAGSVEDRVVVAPGDVFSRSIVPRIVVDIIRHVSVKADEDTA